MTPQMEKSLSELASAIEKSSGRGFRPVGQMVAQLNLAIAGAPAVFVSADVDEVEGGRGKFAGSIAILTTDLIAVARFDAVPAAGWGSDRELGEVTIAVHPRADLRGVHVVSGVTPRSADLDPERFTWGTAVHLQYDGLGEVRLKDQRASLDEVYPSLLADLARR